MLGVQLTLSYRASLADIPIWGDVFTKHSDGQLHSDDEASRQAQRKLLESVQLTGPQLDQVRRGSALLLLVVSAS